MQVHPPTNINSTLLARLVFALGHTILLAIETEKITLLVRSGFWARIRPETFLQVQLELESPASFTFCAEGPSVQRLFNENFALFRLIWA